MSTVVSAEARISDIKVTADTITAYLVDGRVISVPLAWSWRLSDATPAQRAHWEIIGDGHGVHWPHIDEDISAEGLLHGVPAHRPRKPMQRIAAPDQGPHEPRHKYSQTTKTPKLVRAKSGSRQ
ncbi:MAG TPA: DUF2442 domain-containing protein [Nitrospiraceae bacterium]|nr:DUF2442 domain-containing protein [Nitrospiraceae bacterium]